MRVIQIAICEIDRTLTVKKAGRVRSGYAGTKARAKSLTKEEPRETTKLAAEAR